MYKRRSLILGVLAAGLLPAQDGQQSVQVTGAVKHALTLTADDLAKPAETSLRTDLGIRAFDIFGTAHRVGFPDQNASRSIRVPLVPADRYRDSGGWREGVVHERVLSRHRYQRLEWRMVVPKGRPSPAFSTSGTGFWKG